MWSEREYKTPAEYGLQHDSTPHPPPPHSHTLSVYTVHLVWEGGGKVRVKVEGQQYHGGNSSQARSKIPTMSECISSL